MTEDEWNALGLYGNDRSSGMAYEKFVGGAFTSFGVLPKTRIVVGLDENGEACLSLGYFKTLKQANLVALTLRITNPR